MDIDVKYALLFTAYEIFYKWRSRINMSKTGLVTAHVNCTFLSYTLQFTITRPVFDIHLLYILRFAYRLPVWI